MTPEAAPAGFRIVSETDVGPLGVHRAVRAMVEDPSGSTFARAFLRTCNAVAIVPIDGDETVVLLRQYRAPLDAEILEIPAGLCDVDGESPEATAARELAEEAGLRAESYERLIVFANAAGIADHLTTIFLARGLSPCAKSAHGPEETHMTVSRVPLQETIEMIGSGEIFDAKTVIGVLLARDRLSAMSARAKNRQAR